MLATRPLATFPLAAPAGTPAPPPPPPITPTWPATLSRPNLGIQFTYFFYDLLTGNPLGSVPMRGVTFSSQLNTPGQLAGTIDLYDPRVQAAQPLQSTTPNRSCLIVDYGGAPVWAGIVNTRRWDVQGSLSNTQGTWTIQASEIWSYFQQRNQATDYSAPPSSGIVDPMSYWTAYVWDATLIAAQIISDAIGYQDSATMPYGDLLGGLGLQINGADPDGSSPVAPSGDWINVTYPWTSAQSVDTIVTQLSQLGLGTGFDFGVDVAYSGGMGSSPVATINISYPRRGRTFAQNQLMVDLTNARGYSFPEDGTQTANTILELGGTGAITVDQNVYPLDQGYPLWERVMSRANMQSANIISLLTQTGLADLAVYSYAPVTPTVKLGVDDPSLPLGSYIVGDDVRLFLPETAPDGKAFDPRFPAGLDQEWRITEFNVTVADQGDATVELSLAQPPDTEVLSPAI